MKKILTRSFQILLLAFIIIQFFRPAKNKSAVISANDITRKYAVPPDVLNILQTSCYDCHSNNTKYPWYSYIQPIAWWLNSHIQDGKKGLNFSEFGSYPIGKQYKRLADIDTLINNNEMPLDSYLWIHKYAKLDEQQKQAIVKWVVATRDNIYATYPRDSLERKNRLTFRSR